ncbi:hypothetical protein HK101_011720 [Irineochytrium annulatum]|nr:hypothetical protein HK101_011720 [Irineochytrium annulatum]
MTSHPRAHLSFRFASTDAAIDAEEVAYDRCRALIRAQGPALGIDQATAPEDLDEVQVELVQSAASGPEDSVLRFQPPPPRPPSRVVIELDAAGCPKASDNFLRLCVGDTDSRTSRGKKLHFKGCPLHRGVRNFMVQTGDVTRHDGSGGESVHAGGKFNDEKAGLKVKPGKGSVCMANSGKNSNTSQFFIVLGDPAKETRVKDLEGKHVVFAKVVEGLEVLERLNAATREKGNRDETLTEVVLIEDCGVI